ncbi:MAG: glycosyltransferase family 2 protein [Bacteroidia bacterium]
MKDFPKISIVILNWNGKKWLDLFLPSVLNTTYPHVEIVLVDNASTDESVAFVQANFPSIKVIVLDQNYGFAEGNNRALAHIDTKYYVLLNSDVEVHPDWLQPLVELMESDEKIASIQPKILAYHDKNSFEYAGAAGGLMDRYAYPFCYGRLFDLLEKDEGQYETPREIFWATGACCLIRKSVTDEIGLFEASFFAHMEEIDFCWRAKNFGYKIYYQPQSKIWHVGGGTLHKSNPRKTYLNIHNSLATMLRNLPVNQLLSKILVRLCLDGVFGIKLMTEGKWRDVWAVATAHWAFYAKARTWWKSRPHPSPSATHLGMWEHSLVWRHFFKREKSPIRELE